MNLELIKNLYFVLFIIFCSTLMSSHVSHLSEYFDTLFSSYTHHSSNIDISTICSPQILNGCTIAYVLETMDTIARLLVEE
jgi:hypothetical protein